MNVAERIRRALHGNQPGSALRTLVNELSSEGREKADVVAEFERFIIGERERIAGLGSVCLPATSEAQEANEQIVLDILDALQGCCHPTARLDIG